MSTPSRIPPALRRLEPSGSATVRPPQSRQQEHIALQRQYSEGAFEAGPRWSNLKGSPAGAYIVRCRIEEAIKRLLRADLSLSPQSSVLVLCAGDGYEGIVLLNLGFSNVTISDLSAAIVQTAVRAEPRLKSLSLNAEHTGLPEQSFDIVIVQDGLHHLPRPVLGFTEMLRIASHAALFLEPHRSLVGRWIGTDWETNGEAVNYVFRWSLDLVRDVASSYLGRDTFRDFSFSYWHHNPVFERIAIKLGDRKFAIACIRFLKGTLDFLLPRMGNQICGLIIKNPRRTQA